MQPSVLIAVTFVLVSGLMVDAVPVPGVRSILKHAPYSAIYWFYFIISILGTKDWTKSAISILMVSQLKSQTVRKALVRLSSKTG